MLRYLLLPALFFLTISIHAQDVTKDFKTNSISIFKNGTAFFVKSGIVKSEDKTYRMTENIPPALFGTYWVLSPSGEVTSMSSYVDTLNTTNSVFANSLSEMMVANIGKKVTLHLTGDENELLEGTMEEVAKGKITNPRNPRETMEVPIPNIINFKMNGKWMTLNMNQIKRIEFSENPKQEYQRKQKEAKPVLQIDFASNKTEQALDMMYLSKGMSWTPIYLIELLDEKKARLTLRAEVVNNIEDIENTTVNFVVGVPNFSYAKQLTALTDFSKLGNFNSHAEMNFHNISNANFAQQQTNNYGIHDMNSNIAVNVNGLDGSAEEDLYFYTLKNMTLKKMGRGHYPVFSAEIDIAHIYECNLPQNTANKNSYKKEYLFSVNPNKVIHSIKINNNTKYPFTTGPALVVKQQGDTKPISQDKLNYTSIKGHSFVKLTEAPDVQITQAEKSISNKDKAKTITKGKHNYHYDLLKVEGQVVIKNYKAKDIDINVRRTIIGDLQESSIKWLKSERVTASSDLNKLTDICWETNVKAGQELKITYVYEILIPH
ncbi:MAG: hypothetical protein ACI8YQ_004367 [Polaribacter sp.]|jgi:hypothetical protein